MVPWKDTPYVIATAACACATLPAVPGSVVMVCSKGVQHRSQTSTWLQQPCLSSTPQCHHHTVSSTHACNTTGTKQNLEHSCTDTARKQLICTKWSSKHNLPGGNKQGFFIRWMDLYLCWQLCDVSLGEGWLEDMALPRRALAYKVMEDLSL